MRLKTRSSQSHADAEFDAEFVRTQRSDWTYVAIRVVTLAVVFWFLARSIAVHGVTAGFLLLPLAVECARHLFSNLLCAGPFPMSNPLRSFATAWFPLNTLNSEASKTPNPSPF